ncbi:MAG TPA: iron ABC transporter permease, partial [Alphaproteobacteria bacterium]|nr:iron ABC transporter permease [Alphaproteobacteria bacterium]
MATIGQSEGRVAGRVRGARPNLWTVGGVVLALIVASPIVAVVASALAPNEGVWSHLAATVLPLYLENTGWLLLGVGTGVLSIGIATAWLVSMCRFPGRAVFEWALLLPIAIPPYVIAFVYTDLLEFAGPVQTALRGIFGWQTVRDYWFPDIRTIGGAVTVMSLVFYPYVYLLGRAAFMSQSVCVLEASRVLGRGPWNSFFTVALPLARPALVAGLSLALMETLADFGTVKYFAVSTFTTGIYRVWLDVNEPAAAQMAATLLCFVLVLIGVERWSRRERRFDQTTQRYRPLPGYRLGGWRAAAAVVVCAAPILLGFVVPAVVLADHALFILSFGLDSRFLLDLWHSLVLAGMAALTCIAAALFLAYGVRLTRSPVLTGMSRFASIGYAVPGSVLAVGVVVPLARLDHAIGAVSESLLGISTGLIFGGTVFALLFAYV